MDSFFGSSQGSAYLEVMRYEELNLRYHTRDLWLFLQIRDPLKGGGGQFRVDPSGWLFMN